MPRGVHLPQLVPPGLGVAAVFGRPELDGFTILESPHCWLAGDQTRNGLAGGPDIDSAGEGGEIARGEDHGTGMNHRRLLALTARAEYLAPWTTR